MDKSIVPRRETVEVDKDLFEYVQQHAIPLKDDFSSALRKLLFPEGPTSPTEPDDYLPAPVPAEEEPPTPRPKVDLLPKADYQLPILDVINDLGGSAPAGEVLERLYRKLKKFFTEDDLDRLPSRDEPRWENRARWVSSDLSKKKEIKKQSGFWSLTDKGRRRLLASGPTHRK